MAATARTVCCDHALRLAQIFKDLAQRGPANRITLHTMQQAGTAALILLAASKDEADAGKRTQYITYIHFLADIILQMSTTYVPAERMWNTLTQILEDPIYQLDITKPVAQLTSSMPRLDTYQDLTVEDPFELSIDLDWCIDP